MHLHHRPAEPRRDVPVELRRSVLDPSMHPEQPVLNAGHPPQDRIDRHHRRRHVHTRLERPTLELHRDRQLVDQVLAVELTTRRREVPLDEIASRGRVEPPRIGVTTPDMHQAADRAPQVERHRDFLRSRRVQLSLHDRRKR
jgi:hypothetical protein